MYVECHLKIRSGLCLAIMSPHQSQKNCFRFGGVHTTLLATKWHYQDAQGQQLLFVVSEHLSIGLFGACFVNSLILGNLCTHCCVSLVK